MPIRATALHLHHAPLSGCSARIRIALHLKRLHDINLPITYHPVNLSASDHHTPAYRSLNPNASIPTLVVELDASQQKQPTIITITQSLAIIDALDTLFPSSPPRLIPAPPFASSSADSSAAASLLRRRAAVLDLVALVACDVQPPANKRWRDAITTDYGGDGEAWARRVYERGLGAYEELLATGEQGRFSVGDGVSAADVFLVPAVEGAMRVGLCEVGRRWPRVGYVVRECARLEAFRVGGLGVVGEEFGGGGGRL
ncbi:Maleylacetoacetate isomerase [Lasiodiplodia theobromae]|uniref:Maleylacetoacetate isomerase n=1 Tax=Lasiodiplodia theobromae TaxID=45133 RepID=UPI0015C396A6|nr:Maleylacetoacetate isomerase [Lasiodiplodia theobromae]KAF4537638.1 Maleylacetoacetate isomerase [Lasiodiplodia theobromae]